MFPFFDWTFILLLPALALSLYAQWKVKTTFAHYSKVPSGRGLTGAAGARLLLDAGGLSHVPIEPVQGRLSDHYDPRTKVLRLSPDVAGRDSLAALGVAAHEVGHALQDAEGYAPMRVRASLVPAASLGSNLGMILFIVGLFIGRNPLLMNAGILLFSAAVLFTVVTLPVEFNASRRALALLSSRGLLVSTEVDGARKVLSAAGLTYVAAALMAVAQLARLLLISRNR
ncbi:MAG TPA: zinc metallopeptidase [Thermoleophilia bacterium]|nr:zinc metallopeptidase [Thermoleophilia bacterium]